MPVSSQAFVPKVGVGATVTKITNLAIATAATEVSHALNDNLRAVIIKSRNTAKLQVAFTATESGTKFVTIHKGTALCLNDLELDSETLYIQSDIATTVEILELHN